ncbi:MAG: cation diffusion facilitator family transporter [Pseudomonadota bacterium]|jgi:cobalt-zinc-cadmium efflux system protein
MAHEHTHEHHGHHHAHGHEGSPARALGLAVGLTLGFAAIEAVAGWWSGALVLLGDAAHMVTDAFALGLAALAAWLARRPADRRHSYGFGRVEMLGALINALLMLGVVAGITHEAIVRLQSPPQLAAGTIAWVALIGLVVNLLVARLLWPSGENINVRGALLHVLGDLLGSIVALATGIVLLFTEAYWLDPVLSLVICVLIGVSALRLLREAVHQLMDGVPLDLSLDEVEAFLSQLPGVEHAHHIHVWRIHGGMIGLTAHLTVPDPSRWPAIVHAAQTGLEERFNIRHATLQPSFGGDSSCDDLTCSTC